VQRIDRALGLALALLSVAVLWSARSFPTVPGQKLGAGFLPLLVGAGLLLCGLVLVFRRATLPHDEAAGPAADETYRSAFVFIGVIAAYVGLADGLGFLLVAPVMLVILLRTLEVGWRPSVAWAIGGTLVVHFAFYKLLRVPLPWGLLRPFY